MEGWVKFHRKMLDWEWFKNVGTCHLFMYCIMKANNRSRRFMGVDVNRGSFASSYQSISVETGLTIQQVRTAINHLKSTGQLTVQPHSKYSVFTVVSYEQYQQVQQDEQQTTNIQLTDNQHATNMQSTCNQQQREKERKKEGKNKRIINTQGDKEKRFVKPSVDDVREYIKEKGYGFSAEAFMAYYNGNGWKVGRTAMKSWKDTCDSWHYRRNDDKAKPQKNVNAQKYEQRKNDLDGAFRQFSDAQIAAMMEDDE